MTIIHHEHRQAMCGLHIQLSNSIWIRQANSILKSLSWPQLILVTTVTTSGSVVFASRRTLSMENARVDCLFKIETDPKYKMYFSCICVSLFSVFVFVFVYVFD